MRTSVLELAPDFLVVDERFAALHSIDAWPTAAPLCHAPRFVVPSGEASKSWDLLGALLEALAAAGVERGGRLLAIGGGVTTDLAGLAAALYQRGISWDAVPTTLLAQIDASVGGKTAVNSRHGKNLFGAFHQPESVWIDSSVLATLDLSDWQAGLGEVLKMAVLGARMGDGMLVFEALEADADELRSPAACNVQLCCDAIEACVRFKADVVAADFREAGARLQLNLGHTYGHGIEAASNYAVPHGIAVALGLGLAIERAAREGLLEDVDLGARVRHVATALGLPTGLDQLVGPDGRALDPAQMRAAMSHDKKNQAGKLRLILPQAIGRYTVLATETA